VLMLHGVSSSASEMATLARLAESLHPGTVATSLPLFEGKVTSLVPLKLQVLGVARRIRQMVAANASLYGDGYHLVCKSQGGLICRCVLEEMDDHRVDTFVSLAGPQMGVYGPHFFSFFPPALQNLTADQIYRVAYTPALQDTLSVRLPWPLPFPCLSHRPPCAGREHVEGSQPGGRVRAGQHVLAAVQRPARAAGHARAVQAQLPAPAKGGLVRGLGAGV